MTGLALLGDLVRHSDPLGGAILIGLAVVGVLGFAWLASPSKSYTEYRCDICGYEWKLKRGEVGPEVKIRPDLMHKGEQRLREEEEARRRRMD